VRRWIGRWIMAVAAVHCIVGGVVFGTTWRALLAEGLFGTVHGQRERALPFWFLSFGLLALLLGGLVDHLERQASPLPPVVGWGLLALLAAMLSVMPASGGWLLLPAVAGALWRRPRPGATTTAKPPSGGDAGPG